jgi:hypothetical protein
MSGSTLGIVAAGLRENWMVAKRNRALRWNLCPEYGGLAEIFKQAMWRRKK